MLLIRAPHRKPRDWLTTIQQSPVAREKWVFPDHLWVSAGGAGSLTDFESPNHSYPQTIRWLQTTT